ncbi:glycosylphosphatidylinositol anchor biosynthesis [Tulasnella sp. 418]|nr:glycosylphosphatidylinositol anchor biosynthesis [Tulasnella sp. 418]
MALPKPVLRLLFILTAVLSYLAYDHFSSLMTPSPEAEAAAEAFFTQHYQSNTQGHTNNWAVLVCSSRYWFNYRHMANALGMYRTVKRLGIPDSNIILMLADDAACNTRNRFPGSVYSNKGKLLDLYGENIEVDYRGYEVTVENFIRLLTGRVSPTLPRSKRLLTDDRSNIFLYMTGHGGNEFLKFQDNEEISAFDLADAIEQMWQKKRYNEIFFMIDTCQANTMYSKLYSPNILATGSSKLGENSYSYENDPDLGVAVIDSYTHHVLSYLENVNKSSQLTMQDLFSTYNFHQIRSHAGVRTDLFNRGLDKTLLTDFFGGVAQVEVVDEQVSSGEPSSAQASPKVEPEASRPPKQPRAIQNPQKARPKSTIPSSSDSNPLINQAKGWGALLALSGLFVWSMKRAEV